MINKHEFYLNSIKYSCSQKISLKTLLLYFDYSSKLIVLEYNGLVCSKSKWNKIIIKSGDRIELVTIVGGG